MDTSFGTKDTVSDNQNKADISRARFFCDEVVNLTQLISQIEENADNTQADLFVYNLIPFPYCITKEGSVRKMGVSVGPKKFIECFDRTRFAPLIQKQQILTDSAGWIQVCSQFSKHDGRFSEDDMSFNLEEFQSELKKIRSMLSMRNIKGMDILIGGSNQAIESYLSVLPESSIPETALLLISPKTGLEETEFQEQLSNDQFLTSVSSRFTPLQVTHLGLIDYLVSNPESQKIFELGHQAIFLSQEEPEKIIEDIRNILGRETSLGKKIILVIDLDVMKSKEFPGKSQASVDGITQNTMIQLANLIALNRQNIVCLILTNFNPTVEKELSSLFLVTFVYRLIKYSLI